MGRIFDFLLRRKSVYSLRKKYDKLREKTDKITPSEKRITVLHALDQIEPTINILEEQITPDFERNSLIRYISISLEKVEKIMKDHEYSYTNQQKRK